MTMQNRKQQEPGVGVESLREPAGDLTLRSVDERLHLDKHRPRALSRHERHAARDGSTMPCQKIADDSDFAEALSLITKSHLVSPPRSGSCRRARCEAAAEIAFEVRTGSTMCSSTRGPASALLVTCPLSSVATLRDSRSA